MKKLIIAAMALSMVLSMTSCGNDNSSGSAKAETSNVNETATEIQSEEAVSEDKADEENESDDEETEAYDFSESEEISEEAEEEFDPKKAFNYIPGEYECTYANKSHLAKDMELSTVKSMFKGKRLTITPDGTLEMDGNTYHMSVHEPRGYLYTYIFTIDESSCKYEDGDFRGPYSTAEFEGPSYFNYIVKSHDIGFNDEQEMDEIEMYYSPAETEDWHFVLEFNRVEDIQ